MNDVTQKIRVWCFYDVSLYTAIATYIRENKAKAKTVLIDGTADQIRGLVTAGVRDDLPGIIYKDLLNEVSFEAIAAEFIDKLLRLI